MAGSASRLRARLAVAQARFVAGLAPERLALIERQPLRGIVLRSLPIALPLLFSREAAKGLGGPAVSGVLELKIRDGDGEAVTPFEVAIADGRCRVHRRPSIRPDASVTIGLADMVRMGSGAVDPGHFIAEGIAAGRIELKGDAFLFLRFPNLFRMANRKLVSP